MLLATGGFVPVAGAQPESDAQRTWLLLPSSPQDHDADVEPLLGELARALRNQNLYPLAFDEAKALFESRHSSEPVQVSEGDLDVVRKETEQALLHVATGRNAEARHAVRKVLDRAERALESLNREIDSARNVLNACLYLVRAMLDSGNREAALSRVLECRRLVPDVEPDRHDHPPEVMALLEEAETRLATAPTGSLMIESHPRGCDVYLNGRKLGQTPYEIRELPPGDYRIQAECSQQHRGRVHGITLAAEPTLVHIDHRFDGVVSTRQRLELRYADDAEEARHRMGDALHVSTLGDADTVLLITPEKDALRLDRLDVDGQRVVGSARIAPPRRGRALRRVAASAVGALAEGRSVDLTSGQAEAMSAWQPEAPPEMPEPPTRTGEAARQAQQARADAAAAEAADKDATAAAGAGAQRMDLELPPDASDGGGYRPGVAGPVLGVAGLVGLGASWGMWARLQSLNDEFAIAQTDDPDYLARQGRVDDARRWTVTVGGLGGLLGTAAMPLLLPEADGVPWWAWAGGGVGAALALWGTVPLFAGDMPPFLDRNHIDQGKTRRQQTEVLGSLLIFHAAPLIAMPVTYLLRDAFGGDSNATAGLRIAPGHAEVTLGGRL